MNFKNNPEMFPRRAKHNNAICNGSPDNLQSPSSYKDLEGCTTGNPQHEPLEQEESQLLDHALRWIPEHPPPGSMRSTTLRRPVIIPRIDTGRMLQIPPPFLRAYSPDLRFHDVDQREFVAFIDTLSIAQSAPAPLQLLDIAGKAAGVVPNHWVQLASAGIGVAAGVGTAAIAITRTRRLLERINQEYFAPRGLKASIVKNKDLAEKLGYNENHPVLAPFDVESPYNTLQDRRLKALEPFIAPLSFDIPPPATQRSIINKISAKQIEQRIKKKQEKDIKSHRKQYNALQKVDKAQLQNNVSSPSRIHSESGYLSNSSFSTVSSTSSLSSLVSDLFELDCEIEEVNHKTNRTILKDPRKANKANREKDKEIQKIEEKKEKLIRKREMAALKSEGKQVKQTKKREEQAVKSLHKVEEKIKKEERKIDGMQFILIENL
ncbi:hypothetical protein BX600DRAFT_475026 [Xylariales sp. PMI_506]|nr:hypothetical protein BX600DRAFT_475026 [Xylariales sp. PMI_506]